MTITTEQELLEFWKMLGNSAFQQRFPAIAVKDIKKHFASHIRSLAAVADEKTANVTTDYLRNRLESLITQATLTTQERELFKTVNEDLTTGSHALIALINTEMSDEALIPFEAANAIINRLENLSPASGGSIILPVNMRTGATEAEVFEPLPDGWTPFLMKVYEGDKNAVRLLLQQKVQVNQSLPSGITSLMIAAAKGYADILEMLLHESIENLNKATLDDEWTALMYAAAEGQAESVEKLLNHGANVNKVNRKGLTALWIAVINGHPDVVEKLSHAGANVNQLRPDFKWTPLMHAAIKIDRINVLEKLLQQKAIQIDLIKDDGATALMIAVANGNEAAVKKLLKYGAYVNQSPINKNPSLMIAVENGYLEIVEILLQYDADVNQPGWNGVTALMIAAKKGYASIAEKLLDRGANVKPPESKLMGDGVTLNIPLFIAVKNGHADVLEKLLKYGANVNESNRSQVTLLMMAAEGGHAGVVTKLLQHRADINQTSYHGINALMMAAEEGHANVVKILLQHGANINQTSNKGMTALKIACRNGHVGVVEELLKHEGTLNQFSLTLKDIINLFIRLDPAKITAFIESNKPELLQLIQKAGDLGSISERLNADQNTAVLESIKGELGRLIQTASDFSTVLASLDSKQRTIVFEMIKNNLSLLPIHTAHDFARIMTLLNSSEKIIFFDKVKNQLPRFTSIPDELNIALYPLNEAQRAEAFEILRSYWPQNIKDKENLSRFIEKFPEQKTDIYESLETTWSELITTKADLDYVAKFYNPDQVMRIGDMLLIHILDNYVDSRSKKPEGNKMFSYSQQDKTDAATILKHSLYFGVPLEKSHVGALLQGELKKEITKYLETFRPGMAIEQFLNEKIAPIQTSRQEVKR